MALQQKLTLT